ncbi:TPA: DNA-deoxyinosine glycosylase [bacterium]|jgi:hypoxanthine-DNA glycosylase|nr:DNA-deoxyinosine glycosylase [bacterium]
MKRHVVHPYSPVIHQESKVLILGTVPSLKSIENGFYYGHPQNRFWRIMSYLFNVDFVNASIKEKQKYLLANNVALYDVVYSCDIDGSDDNKITNIVPIDLDNLLKNTKIKHIFLNGQSCFKIFKKYFPHYLGIVSVLPSSSPRNVSYNFEKLIERWKEILNYCK